MTQGVLPFKHEEEKNDSGMTALAGRISKGHPSFILLIAARKRIAMFETAPSG